jgi:hypothetical protein
MFKKYIDDSFVINVVDHMSNEDVFEVSGFPVVSVCVGLWSTVDW